MLVRPNFFLRAVLALMRPFVSAKAKHKILQVASLHELAQATGGEVDVQHLGGAWAKHLAEQQGAGRPAAA